MSRPEPQIGYVDLGHIPPAPAPRPVPHLARMPRAASAVIALLWVQLAMGCGALGILAFRTLAFTGSTGEDASMSTAMTVALAAEALGVIICSAVLAVQIRRRRHWGPGVAVVLEATVIGLAAIWVVYAIATTGAVPAIVFTLGPALFFVLGIGVTVIGLVNRSDVANWCSR